MFLQLQILPVVSDLRSHLLLVRLSHVTSVFHQLLDGEWCMPNYFVFWGLSLSQTDSIERESRYVEAKIKLKSFYNYNFVRTFTVSVATKDCENVRKTRAMGVVGESRKFPGHPYMGRSAWLSLRQHSFLVTIQCLMQPLNNRQCFTPGIPKNLQGLERYFTRPVAKGSFWYTQTTWNNSLKIGMLKRN